MSDPTAREAAVQILLGRAKTSEYTEDLLARELSRGRLGDADRSLVQELAYGIVRWEGTLDWLIQRKTPAGRNQKIALQVLLRLGLYQLFWLERVPDHAAVNETVALAKSLGFGPQAGFVNAVLRAYQREREQTLRLLRELRNERPAAGCSHPEWLFQRWEARWGRERAIALMEWNNHPPAMYARLNTLRASRVELLDAWRAEQVTCEPFERNWVEPMLVFELKKHRRLVELPSFQKGMFYVQDPSTLLSVRELNPRPGEQLLDMCAAPGGKATYAAQCMGNQGRLVAHDPQPHRLALLRENCARLGVTCIEAVESLSAALNAGAAGSFDRVLLDAPCSNTGVLRRRVDLRWRIRIEELERLRRGQAALLANAAERVRPGGCLVYSTCSLEPEENRETTAAFLDAFPSFRLENEREVLPFIDGVDGAYVARFTRQS